MSNFQRTAALLTLSIGALASLPALADDIHYNQISLRAEASQEVPRDLMIVTLYTEAQNTDAAKLAAEITTSMNKAIGQAKSVKEVTLRQGNRNSYPIYDNKTQKITGWRERAELRLESTDFAALSKLTGDLMQTLKMGSMQFTVANATRKTSEDALLKDAVNVQGPRPVGHRRPGRQGLQDRQPEPQHQRLPATLPAQRNDDEGRSPGDGLGAYPGSRSRHQ